MIRLSQDLPIPQIRQQRACRDHLGGRPVKIVSIFLLIPFLILSCNLSPSDGSSGGGGTGDGTLTVYVAGSYNNGSYDVACYWTDNGTVVRTDLSVATAKDSGATDIFVDGLGSIHVSGYYTNASDVEVAVYWKDGVISSDLGVNARATGITVDSGSSVYVSGYYYNGTISNKAVYWIDNGSTGETVLHSGDYARASDIQLDGSGGVYICGVSSSQLGAYWIDNSAGEEFLSGSAGSNAEGVYYYNGKAYFAGRYFTSSPAVNSAAFWVEGVITEARLNTIAGQAYGIWAGVDGIYVAGDYYNASISGRRAAVWLNDASGQADLAGEISTYPTTAYSVMVENGDVYASGTQTQPGTTEAVYWKNGILQVLESGTTSIGIAVFLVP